jgi:hypothetical protein
MKQIDYTNMSRKDTAKMILDICLLNSESKEAFVEQIAQFLAQDENLGKPFLAHIQKPSELVPITIGSSDKQTTIEVGPGTVVLTSLSSLWNSSIDQYYRDKNLVDINGFIAVKIVSLLLLTTQFEIEAFYTDSRGVVISSIQKCQWYNCRPVQIL